MPTRMLMITTAAPIAPSGRRRQKSPTSVTQRQRAETSGMSPAAARWIAIIEGSVGTRAVATPVPRRDVPRRFDERPTRVLSLPEADPRVEPRVHQVDREVDKDED